MVVFYLGYAFDFSGLSKQIYDRYRQELDLKQQVHVILKTEDEMKSIVLQFPEVVKIVNQWQGQLINGTKLPDLLNQILKIGAANHLLFSLFAPGDKKEVDDYYVVPIKVVVQGNYSQVAHFISQIANFPQIISVGDFVMVKGPSGTIGAEKPAAEANTLNSLTTALTLEVYYRANKK
jgi:type IV pilus assembly protein PilO